jgi:hypothetical protein
MKINNVVLFLTSIILSWGSRSNVPCAPRHTINFYSHCARPRFRQVVHVVYCYDGADTAQTQMPICGTCRQVPVHLLFGAYLEVHLIDTRDCDTMSTVPHEAASATEHPLANLLFDHPGADITLGSQDSSLFQVPKIYIIDSSPILSELIQRTLDSPSSANPHTSLPVVQLPERGEIIYRLLTFIFPITPLLPSTPEEIMELLSVAQKYQMGAALTHIRGSIALQNSLSIHLDTALHIYALAQKYGLRPEALQAARVLFLKQSMNIEDLDNKLDIMPGASLYELWKYNGRVQAILESDLAEFTASGGRGTIAGLRCRGFSTSQIPSWLNYYIASIGNSLKFFDLIEFNTSMARHIKNLDNSSGCECASIPSQTIREFWEALTFVVDGSFETVSGRYNKLFMMLNHFTGRASPISRAGPRGLSSPNQFNHISP